MVEIFLISFLIIFYCFIYLKIFKNENIIFIKFFSYFLIYTFLIYLILNNIETWKSFEHEFKILLIVTYFINFASIILIINLKSLYSPSDFIYQSITKNKICSKDQILKDLKKENIIEKRIDDLKKQRLINNNNQNLELTNFGNIFVIFFHFVKKFYNLKSEG